MEDYYLQEELDEYISHAKHEAYTKVLKKIDEKIEQARDEGADAAHLFSLSEYVRELREDV